MNFKQFSAYVLRPALESMSLYSDNVVCLLLSTMAQESQGEYLRQKNGGPALGPFEMEKNTHDDIWKYDISNKQLEKNIMIACNLHIRPQADDMIYNLRYSCIMARIAYLRHIEPIPKYGDEVGMWLSYKKYWNTNLGAATIEEFMINYEKYVKPLYL